MRELRALVIVTATAAAVATIVAVEATHVSVCRDATYEVPASRCQICSGTGVRPAGSACPRKGDVAVGACRKGLPSYGGTANADAACVAKEDAVCELVRDSTWGCVFPGVGCPPTPTSAPVAAATKKTEQCPDWTNVKDDVVAVHIFDQLPGDHAFDGTLIKETWFVQEHPVADISVCNQKPTSKPTLVPFMPPMPEPIPTPKPMAQTPQVPKPTNLPMPTSTGPATQPKTQAPPPAKPMPMTEVPKPITEAPPPITEVPPATKPTPTPTKPCTPCTDAPPPTKPTPTPTKPCTPCTDAPPPTTHKLYARVQAHEYRAVLAREGASMTDVKPHTDIDTSWTIVGVVVVVVGAVIGGARLAQRIRRESELDYSVTAIQTPP